MISPFRQTKIGSFLLLSSLLVWSKFFLSTKTLKNQVFIFDHRQHNFSYKFITKVTNQRTSRVTKNLIQIHIELEQWWHQLILWVLNWKVRLLLQSGIITTQLFRPTLTFCQSHSHTCLLSNFLSKHWEVSNTADTETHFYNDPFYKKPSQNSSIIRLLSLIYQPLWANQHPKNVAPPILHTDGWFN